jgi:hypothetical protein
VTLQPGCPLVVAPAFHLPTDWAGRLLLGAGVPREWRQPDEQERSLLVHDPSTPLTRERLLDALCLFQLPKHLQSAWWRLLERAGDTGAPLEGFDDFVVEVARFLAFKELPAPEGAVFDLLVSRPGLSAVGGEGLPFNLPVETPLPPREEPPRPRTWGGINLGDEPTWLVFVNRPARDLMTELGRSRADLPPPATLGELAERFFNLCPDYPLVRLRIDPGEGFRLPAGGLLVAGCTLDKQEPDVMLLIRADGTTEA